MDTRKRRILATLWFAVAGIIAITLGPTVPTEGSDILRLFVIIMSLFLGVVYLFDPWGVTSHTEE